MQIASSANSYKINHGVATLASVTKKEIASLLNVGVRSRELRRLFEDVRGGTGGVYDIVHAAHLVLKVEYERIGLCFDSEAVKSVLTLFWHAYAKLEGTVSIIGENERVQRLTKGAASKVRLADRLTDHPSTHRYVYRSVPGSPGTALDLRVLRERAIELAAAIDLEGLAVRLHDHLKRPLITLVLNGPRCRSNPAHQTATRRTRAASRLAA